jgi:ABC-2 type transport system ATP-binding protein
MPVAELKAISKDYGEIAALRGIDLAIQPGELLALLGPNGAGKTTAVRILLGLTAPTSGAATVFGHHPMSREAKLRRGAQLQVANIPDTLKVREHIELFSSYYKQPLPVSETIAVAGLKSVENRLLGNLSGGQKQRVLFALAICGNPGLLILDEPTVGLDVEARRGLWTRIREYVSRGGSVLLTTHYLDEADALAKRIAVINRGLIVAEGTPSEIKQRGAAASLEDAYLAITHEPNRQMEEVY